MQEVGALLAGAARAGRRVASFGIDAEVRFASAADRAAFAEELAQAVAALVSRYHDEAAPGGRSNRLVVALHQIPATASSRGSAAREAQATGAEEEKEN